MAGVVRGVVHGFDVREAGKVDQAQAEQAGANGDDQALAEGDRSGDAVFGTGDGHDAILCFAY